MHPLSYNCTLLIDDDGVTNFINYRLIKKMALTDCIQSVINGNEALKFLQDFALKNNGRGPELILLDINMPVLNGFEFLEYFEKMELANKKDIKIVILTTSTHQRDLLKISSSGFELDYINKPLTEEKLRTCLNKIKPAGAANS